MTVKDLHTMSINIPWLEIFKATYNDVQMTEETDVIVVSPQVGFPACNSQNKLFEISL